jgi:hypothetical protein
MHYRPVNRVIEELRIDLDLADSGWRAWNWRWEYPFEELILPGSCRMSEAFGSEQKIEQMINGTSQRVNSKTVAR